MSNGLPANYVEIAIVNQTDANKGGKASTDLYVFVQSQTQVYEVDSAGVAQPVASPADGAAPSIKLSALPTNTHGDSVLYLDAGTALTSGRIYYSDSDKAVSVDKGAINGPNPASAMNFGFIELTVYKNKVTGGWNVNLDTTEIDQFGFPVSLQIDPQDDNFPNGTGIQSSETRASVISKFTTFAGSDPFKPYIDCVQSSPETRLLGPQHVIGSEMPQFQLRGTLSATGAFTITGTWTDPSPKTLPTNGALWVGMRVSGQGVPAGATVSAVDSTSPQDVTLSCPTGETFAATTGAFVSFFKAPATTLATAFDEAIYQLFDYYHNTSTTSPKNYLYLMANGHTAKMEIYQGEVITDCAVEDMNGSSDTKYTVFQFTGTGLTYDDASNALSASHLGKGSVYNVFYPFFSTNCAQSPGSNALTPDGPPPPPHWWTPGFDTKLGNINFVAPPSEQVFACDGVFGDSQYQKSALGTSLQDDTVLGNLENQLVTWLNRGVTPTDGGSSPQSNLQLRAGYVPITGFGPPDPSQKASTTDDFRITKPAPSAAGTYPLSQPGALIASIQGTVKVGGTQVQTFTIGNDNGLVLDPATAGSLHLINGHVEAGKPPQLVVGWSVPPSDAEVSVTYDYATPLSDNYATLKLVDPYSPSNSPYEAGSLGPQASPLSTGLAKGMQLTTMVNFSQPMDIYYVDPAGSDEIVIYSPVSFQTGSTNTAFNTGILNFASFYSDGFPMNGYSRFFHLGSSGNDPPTIDGRGYAFPFDDNGGYSSDLDVPFKATTGRAAKVTVTLLPWDDKPANAEDADADSSSCGT